MSEVCHTHCHGDHLPTAVVPRRDTALDTLAALLSSLCLLHCIGLPVLVALLPALAMVVPDLPWLHAGLLMLAVPASGLALLRGWRAHGDRMPATLGGIGLVVMGAALTVPAHGAAEIALTVGGGLLVATGHLLNLRAGGQHRR